MCLTSTRCERCGFTLYPAKGREFKFFSDRFKCPSCGAGKDLFYDANDPDDPRNQVRPTFFSMCWEEAWLLHEGEGSGRMADELLV